MLFDLEPVVFDVVPHADSVSRVGWVGSHDDRPLSPRGRDQAVRLAEELAGNVGAIYSSPSLRCVQTVEPLSRAAGLVVYRHEGLRETDSFAEPSEWVGIHGDSVGGSWAAGRGVATLTELARRHPGQRLVVCSHGDLVPVTVSFLAALAGTTLPHAIDRGGWLRVWIAAGTLTVTGYGPSIT